MDFELENDFELRFLEIPTLVVTEESDMQFIQVAEELDGLHVRNEKEKLDR